MGARRRSASRAPALLLALLLLCVALSAWLVVSRKHADVPESTGVMAARPDGGEEDAAHGGAVDAVPVADSGVSVFSERGSAEQVATRLLASYRDRGDCVLASSGYLDLVGSVWGCVVQGGTWVDVCTVFEAASPASCEVRILHMEADELRELWQ